MALTEVKNFLLDNKIESKVDTNESKVQTYINSNNHEFPYAEFESIFKKIESVMNSNSPTPSKLQRCPSNVSDISGISSFSLANKTPKALYSDYHCGDYVYVDSISGVKYGVIRFAGYVDFAKGYWFGIELDGPNGKNNGTIKGKTYFTCPDNHGIFTQSSKISKSPPIKKTHRLSSAGSVFGSKESVNSSVYLKRNGLNTSQESLRSCVSGVSAITGVFKQPSSKNLKNQFLKAKHLETDSSSSRTSADRVDNLREELSYLSVQESEQLVKSKIELSNQKRELEEQVKQNENEISELKIVVNEEKRLSKELINQLEEKKKKMEMLEFRIEEEKITRMNLEEEIQKKEKLIQELKRKSDEAANSKNEDKEIELFELQEDLIKKEEKILQLESTLKSKQNENSNLLERTREFEQTIKVFEQSQKNYLTKIDDLNLKIKKYELEKSNLEDALENSAQEKKGNLNSLTSELSIKNKELEESKDQLTKKSNEILMLKDELERMNKKCTEIEIEKSNLETNKINLTKQIEILEQNKRSIDESTNRNEFKQAEERKKLLEQIANHKQELNEYKNKLEELSKAEANGKQSLNTKEVHIKEIENELISTKKELENLKNDLNKFSSANVTKDSELEKLRLEIKRLSDKISQNQLDKQQLENELDNFKIQLEEKENNLNSFNKKKLQYQNELENLMREISNEKEKNRQLLMNNNQINELQTNQLVDAEKELKLIRNAHEKATNQLEEQINLVNNLQIEYNKMEIKAKNLETTNNDLKLLIEQRNQAKDDEINSLRDEHSKVIDEVKNKLDRYEKNLKKLEDGLVNKDFEINSLQLEHQQMIEQQRLDNNLKCSELEKQIIRLKNELDNKQRELDNQIDKIQISQDDQMNNDDKDLYESQIKFLNSCIVDMQIQNDKLKSKVKMLEEIRLEEMNMFKPVQDGDHEDDKFSFRLTNDQLNNNQSLYLKSTTQRTTRLFCSYCDQFDKHDTEDCPNNLKTIQEENAHTKLNQSKKQSRAYCVNCEIFSHWTHECPNQKS